jgi:hypothetical protein
VTKQGLKHIFTDEPHDEAAPECQNTVNGRDQDQNLDLGSSVIPLGFASWQKTLNLSFAGLAEPVIDVEGPAC